FALAPPSQQLNVKLVGIGSLRTRHHMIAPEGPDLVLHPAFLMPFPRRTELRLEPPVGSKRVETGRLLPPKAAQNPLDGGLQVVVAHPLKNPAEIAKGNLVRFQKRLLGRAHRYYCLRQCYCTRQ